MYTLHGSEDAPTIAVPRNMLVQVHEKDRAYSLKYVSIRRLFHEGSGWFRSPALEGCQP
jgi:hypothetical protein